MLFYVFLILDFLSLKDGVCQLENLISDVSSTQTLGLFQSSGLSSFSSPVMRHLPNIVREFCPSIVNVTGTPSLKTSQPMTTSTARQRVDIVLVSNVIKTKLFFFVVDALEKIS